MSEKQKVIDLTGSNENGQPPYVPFSAFKNVLEKLSSDGVPYRLDRVALAKFGVKNPARMVNCLHFFNLIDPQSTGNPRLAKLIRVVRTDKWPATLASFVKDAYAPIIGSLNIEQAKYDELNRKFRQAGGVATYRKSVRFYLKALEEAGVQYSNYFPRVRSAVSAPRGTGGDEIDDGPVATVVGSEALVFPIHFPGRASGQVSVPRDINEDDVALIEAAFDYVLAYAKRTKGGSQA